MTPPSTPSLIKCMFFPGSEINKAVEETKAQYENYLFKAALRTGFFEFQVRDSKKIFVNEVISALFKFHPENFISKVVKLLKRMCHYFSKLIQIK